MGSATLRLSYHPTTRLSYPITVRDCRTSCKTVFESSVQFPLSLTAEVRSLEPYNLTTALQALLLTEIGIGHSGSRQLCLRGHKQWTNQMAHACQCTIPMADKYETPSSGSIPNSQSSEPETCPSFSMCMTLLSGQESDLLGEHEIRPAVCRYDYLTSMDQWYEAAQLTRRLSAAAGYRAVANLVQQVPSHGALFIPSVMKNRPHMHTRCSPFMTKETKYPMSELYGRSIRAPKFTDRGVRIETVLRITAFSRVGNWERLGSAWLTRKSISAYRCGSRQCSGTSLARVARSSRGGLRACLR